MGRFLEDMKSSRFEPVAIRQRFRLEYTSTGNDVYAFFESTDDGSFYGEHIRQYVRSSGRLRLYYCGNKRSVWHHYEFAQSEGKLRNAIFFVDKDLDDLTGTQLPDRREMFITEFYSVENYLCTDQALTAALEEVVFLPDEHGRYALLAHHFNQGLNKLATHLMPMFAEVIFIRRQGESVSFNDFGDSLSCCFEVVDLKPLPLTGWLESFRVHCKYDARDISSVEMQEIMALLAAKPYHAWLRGKFALWFFLQFLDGLWNEMLGEKINDRKKIKKTLQLRADNVFLVMQGKHPMPLEFHAFMKTNLFEV